MAVSPITDPNLLQLLQAWDDKSYVPKSTPDQFVRLGALMTDTVPSQEFPNSTYPLNFTEPTWEPITLGILPDAISPAPDAASSPGVMPSIWATGGLRFVSGSNVAPADIGAVQYNRTQPGVHFFLNGSPEFRSLTLPIPPTVNAPNGTGYFASGPGSPVKYVRYAGGFSDRGLEITTGLVLHPAPSATTATVAGRGFVQILSAWVPKAAIDYADPFPPSKETIKAFPNAELAYWDHAAAAACSVVFAAGSGGVELKAGVGLAADATGVDPKITLACTPDSGPDILALLLNSVTDGAAVTFGGQRVTIGYGLDLSATGVGFALPVVNGSAGLPPKSTTAPGALVFDSSANLLYLLNGNDEVGLNWLWWPLT